MRSWLLLLTGCSILPQSLTPPPNDETTVAVLSGSLGHPMNAIARHPWFAVRHAGDKVWATYEVGGGDGREEVDPFRDHTPYLDPIVHKVWRGAEAERAAACIARVAPGVRQRIEADYIFFPGPNSNTFGDEVLRACHLHASLSSTSVGKDYRGLFGAGITSEGTGVQIETPVLGFKIGLKEGIEVHIIGLSFGVDFWPPAVIVPWGTGRVGFADR